MSNPDEYDTKPCSFPNCQGIMALTMRAISEGGMKPRPGWMCGKNSRGLEYGWTRSPDPLTLLALSRVYDQPFEAVCEALFAARRRLGEGENVPPSRDDMRSQEPTVGPARGSLSERLARSGTRVPEFAHVPLLSDPIAAGSPLVISKSDVDTWLAFQKSFIDKFTDPFLAKVGKQEESMLPGVGPGDVVLLDRDIAKRQKPDPRRIYAINRGDGGALKRVQIVGAGPKNGWLAVMSDNPDKARYPTEFEPLKGRKLQDIIVGEVVWHGQHIGVGRRR